MAGHTTAIAKNTSQIMYRGASMRHPVMIYCLRQHKLTSRRPRPEAQTSHRAEDVWVSGDPSLKDSTWFDDGYISMEEYNNSGVYYSAADGSVKTEVVGFFQDNPFLLVSEGRLASLLCRPYDMVCEAVRALEEEGLLKRRFGDALLGVEENLVKPEPL